MNFKILATGLGQTS